WRATETMARVTYFHVIRPLRMSGLEGTALNDAIDRATRPLTPLASQLLNHLTDRVMNDAIRENVVLRFTGYIAEPGQLDVAIAFVDLCGFTPLAEAMGDRESAEVLGRFSTLVRDAVASHTGRIVKQLGDAFMLAFADPRLAVGCAVEIERRAAAMERFPALRSGIHCGLVLFREGDYVGTNVNIAARVAAEAGRHQVLVTNEVRRAAGTVPGVQFTPVARRKLKGVGEEVELFAAAPTEAAAGERAVDPVCGMEIGPAEAAARLALGVRTLADGHVLVVPRAHAASIEELSPAEADALFRTVVRLAGPVREALGAAGTTIGINNGEATGQTIPHVHVHIVPRWPDDDAGSIHTIFPRKTERALADVGAAIRKKIS